MSLLDASTVSGFFTFYASVAEGRPYLAPGTMAENITLLKRNSIKSIKTSPTQVAELVRQLDATDDRLPSIRAAQIAGSVLPPTLARRLRARTSCEIFNMYGSTEIGTVSARYTDSDDPFDAGLPTLDSIIEIVDETDQPVPVGELGRVRCKRPLMSEEYFHDPDASAASFKDGWFYPGDYGIIQPDGTLALRGRESEFINAGGVKLDPVQLDLFAVSLPQVTDACGFGFLDTFGLQQVGLALVTPPDADGKAIAAALQNAFGPAAPRIIVRVDEIPRNAMGKPLRTAFGERYAAPQTS
jgi:acyl-coenzyme A synthetase/AMP-(fatty) acid ligase